MSARKMRVAVLFGGRSGEHEVSLISASSVIKNLDRTRFEVIPIGIDKDGHWHLNDLKRLEGAGRSLPLYKDAPKIILEPTPMERSFDVVFPVMHGTFCEDGAIQGLLEMADIAYVGCGVLASAVGMDKDFAKRLARDAGIPIVPFIAARAGEEVSQRVQAELGYPVFVKPANTGSSLGVHKVKSASEIGAALNDAFKYDTKVLIEKAISAREIEFAVLENRVAGAPPRVSVAGEIVPQHEFYSYEAKYVDENGAKLLIPAALSADQLAAATKIATQTFEVLGCEGMARVDLFLDKVSGEFYLNEINTIPGFTHISMYPKLWEASGLKYADLLTELIELALMRFERRKSLLHEYEP